MVLIPTKTFKHTQSEVTPQLIKRRSVDLPSKTFETDIRNKLTADRVQPLLQCLFTMSFNQILYKEGPV